MIFAGAGVLLLVNIVLDHICWDYSETELTQAAKDVNASQGALIDIFERIENSFGRLEGYAEVPMTEAMKHIMVMIMVEVLGIFAIATKEIKQGRTSELIPSNPLHIAYGNSERYLKRLPGKTDINDALNRLDRLTQEAARMAIIHVLKVAHNIKGRVEIVDDQVKGVRDQVKDVSDQVIGLDDKVKVVGDLTIEGTSGETYHFILFLCFLFSFFFLSSIIVRPGT